MHDRNRNAKVIIPLAIAAWLGGILVFATGAPLVLQVLFIVAFALAVPVTVLYLISASGWRQLARYHKVRSPVAGDWRGIPTGQMALVSVDHPDFDKVKMRFVGGTLRVAVAPEGLGLSTPISRIPVVSWWFPTLHIPWSAVTSAREFEAPGRFTPPSSPGALLQIAYDPNYTGTFVELEIGTPPVFVQLPQPLFGDALHGLPKPAPEIATATQ